MSGGLTTWMAGCHTPSEKISGCNHMTVESSPHCFRMSSGSHSRSDSVRHLDATRQYCVLVTMIEDYLHVDP